MPNVLPQDFGFPSFSIVKQSILEEVQTLDKLDTSVDKEGERRCAECCRRRKDAWNTMRRARQAPTR